MPLLSLQINRMIKFKSFIVINLFLIIILTSTKSFSENHNLLEVLELIQKDLKTLERGSLLRVH